MKRLRLRKLLRKPKKWQWVPVTIVILVGLSTWSIYETKFLAGLWGIRNDEIAVITIEEGDHDRNSPETITVVAPNKSIWDALELLGVPVALAVLGAWFQKTQQAQSDRLSKEQKEQDADEIREEVLQLYFDRISTLLIDKNLMAIAAKKAIKEYAVSEEQKELLEVSIDVIQARTLSILKRFDQDSERKSSTVRFLVEADVVNRLKIDLSGTNLNGTDLSRLNLNNARLFEANLDRADLNLSNLDGANLNFSSLKESKLSIASLKNTFLREADLRGAKLNGSTLAGAKLTKAKLIGANLVVANITATNLSEADLNHANLSGASLVESNLSKANLIEANLIEADLSRANLVGADLRKADLSGANLVGADLRKANVTETQFGVGVGLSESAKRALKARGAIFEDK